MGRSKQKNVKTIFAIVSSLIILIIITLASIAYFQYQNVQAIKELEIKLTQIDIVSIKLTSTTLDATISIFNPNKRTVTIGELEITLSANNMSLTTVKSQAMTIQPQQSILTKIPLKISNLDAGIALIKIIQTKQANWNINGTYTMGPLKIPFEYTQVLK